LSEPGTRRRGKILFRIFKGFIYGVSVGLVFSVAVYLLASAVRAIAPHVPDPSVISGVIFAGSVTVGVAHEYSKWLEEE
jgi:TctA family transporter